MALEYLSHLAALDRQDIHPGGSLASEALLQELSLAPQQHVLEFGCGTAGTLSKVCGRYDVRAAGLDMLPEMLARARRRLQKEHYGERVVLVRGSATRMPFRSASFDAVYCESVLGFQATGDLRAALREIHRVLRPGGRLLANEAIWKPGVEDALAKRINDGCEKDFGLPQATELAWDVDAWCDELRQAGLAVRSYRLLQDLASVPASADGRRALRPYDGGAALQRAAAWFSPALIAARLRYRRLLTRYRPLSDHVEGRLFVAERPPADD